VALILKNKGYEKVEVVKGGWKAMTKAGFPYFWEGRLRMPKTGKKY